MTTATVMPPTSNGSGTDLTHIQVSALDTSKYISIAPKEAIKGAKRRRNNSPAFHVLDCSQKGPVRSSMVAAALPPKRQKRQQYAKQTCLRCTERRRKCSGSFPCLPCVEDWKSDAVRSKATLYWRECFSSKITDLNWSSCLTFAYNPSLDGDALATKLHALKTKPASEQHALAAMRAATYLFEIAVDTMVDSGLTAFLTQVHESSKNTSLATQIEALQVPEKSSDITPRSAFALNTRSRFSKPCLLWTFAALHTHFELIQQLSRVRTTDLLDLRAQLSMEVFRIMAAQIRTVTSKCPTSEARTLLYDCFIVVCTTLCSSAYGKQMAQSLMQSPAVSSTSGTVIDAMLKALWQDEQTATEQHGHLIRYCFHWATKIYSPEISNLYYLFSVGLLGRLDFSRRYLKAEHPLERAKRFLTQFPRSKKAKSQRLCLSLFQEMEQDRDDVGQMKWIECIQRLRASESFVTIEPWPAGGGFVD
ncbi:hypothetical protein LIA77_04982 [Sarocladium implicatum]|nr:hypothetical protein LIA77_04982 [Sarocladium implicatum]